MEFHEIANLFPLMVGDEYRALVEDIRANGLLEPIALYEGKILDGRNRYNACIVLGIEPNYTTYDGPSAEAFVISKNLHRRHLTRDQRDEVVCKLRSQGMTLRKIADAMGVSYGTVYGAAQNQLIKIDKLVGEDGKERPSHYAPRQAEALPKAMVYERTELNNGVVECSRCHQLYDGIRIEYCPYCAFTQDQRIEHLRHEQEKPHVAYNNGNNEWYTPPEYIEAALAVMGHIDLDPASTSEANGVVGEGNLIVPDMLVFKTNKVLWVEAKRKSAFSWHRQTGRWTTGIDLVHYDDYLKVAIRSPWPVWLMFLQCDGRAKDTPPDKESPTGLYCGTLRWLRANENHRSGKWGKGGMVYWADTTLTKLAELEELCPKPSVLQASNAAISNGWQKPNTTASPRTANY